MKKIIVFSVAMIGSVSICSAILTSFSKTIWINNLTGIGLAVWMMSLLTIVGMFLWSEIVEE